METTTSLSPSRAQAIRKAEEASKRANLQQHALKLLQGFDKLDEAAAKKAPWELVQNACDLTERCFVTFDLGTTGWHLVIMAGRSPSRRCWR